VARQRTPIGPKPQACNIGGQEARPDSGYSRNLCGVKSGDLLGQSLAVRRRQGMCRQRRGGRSCCKGLEQEQPWPFARCKYLYYIAENLAARGMVFAQGLGMRGRVGKTSKSPRFESGGPNVFISYAAWADKYGDGQVHGVPIRRGRALR